MITSISLGVMFLGVGLLSWAMLNLYGATRHNAEATLISFSKPELIHLQSMQFKNLYPDYPAEGDLIGKLIIPALNRQLPIFQGTGQVELKKGVGHYLRSVLPGEEDNCVLSGHRDTVFTRLGDLKEGDLLIVDTSAGRFTYEITGTRIVHKDDKTVIVPIKQAVLTLTTCYPFRYIGNAPDRYIVSARLINSQINQQLVGE